MKNVFVVALVLSAGIAHAELPPGMPETASPMTARDDCFQTLRGHVELSLQKLGYQVTRMIEGYGAAIDNGGFKCKARFELDAGGGKAEQTPWVDAEVYAHDQPTTKTKG